MVVAQDSATVQLSLEAWLNTPLLEPNGLAARYSKNATRLKR